MAVPIEDRGSLQDKINSIADSLDEVGRRYGVRPSSLLGWDNPADWYGRLKFDIHISNITRKENISN